MKIKWYGHACFLITSAEGIQVLIDPYDEGIGYDALPALEADLVTVSHDHYDHNHVQAVQGDFTCLKEPGSFEIKGIKVTGLASFHDQKNGAQRGKNVIFVFEIDGVRICHCGDLGHIPSPDLAEKIDRVDILLLPVGGTYTLDAGEAVQTADLIKPSVIIPMHFKTPALNLPISGVDQFLAAYGAEAGRAFAGKQEIEVDQNRLAALSKVTVLEYKE